MTDYTQQELCALILDKLDDLKAQNPIEIDVSTKSSITDTMIIVTGTSDLHVKSLGNYLIDEMKKMGVAALGSEGNASDWVVVDFGTAIVHIMKEEARQEYALEKLWA